MVKTMKNLINKNYLEKYFLVLLSLIPIIGSLLYFFHSLNKFFIILLIFLSTSLSFVFLYFLKKNDFNEEKENLTKDVFDKKIEILDFVYLFFSLFFIIISFRELMIASSDSALISPWQVVNFKFFLFYFFSALFLFLSIIKKGDELKKIHPYFVIIFYLLSFSVCLIVYKIGYGFDPFIHQATIEFIAENGQITPKTPYYIGYYSLVIVINKIFGISIAIINKLIVPFVAAIFIPFLLINFLKKTYPSDNKKIFILSSLPILAIGFSPLIISTPQNLSYIFLLATIIFALKEKSLILAILFSLATSSIHPMSGIPAIIFIAFIIYKRNKDKIKNVYFKKLVYFFALLFSALILPTSLFFANGKGLSIENLKNVLTDNLNSLFIFRASNRADIFLNFNYFFKDALLLIIIAWVILGLVLFFKKIKLIIKKEQLTVFESIFSTVISLFISYLISSMLVFKDVISYEQSDYIYRILLIIVIFSIPFLALSTNHFLEKMVKKNNFSLISWLLFLCIILTSSLYSSYPRIDKYYNSRGYSVSKNDLETVREIDRKSDGEYFVLANQQVSVAALKTFGFNRYLKLDDKEIYFYPIPTGAELYNYYLSAVYDSASRDNILRAMDFTKLNKAYLVINRYWSKSAEIINEAKIESDEYWQTNNEVFIFEYQR